MSTGSINFVPSSLYAEVLAILFGLKLTLENSFSKVIVGSDAQVAIDMIGKGDLGLWEGVCLLQDIHDLAATCAVCSLNFIRREGNVLAHRLAMVQVEIGSFSVWHHSFPLTLCNPWILIKEILCIHKNKK